MITHDQIKQRVLNLPTLPASVGELGHAIADERCTVDKVLAVLSKDPPLSASLLRLANSATYAGANKVSDLKSAVMRLGFDNILSLSRSAAIIRNFKDSKHLDITLLWQHSVAVALTARGICRMNKDRSSEDTAFLLGLLHDIGKFALDHCFPEDYAPVVEALKAGEGIMDAESRILGITHAETGAVVAESWHFPQEFVETIRDHHNPPPSSSMANLLFLSDLMVRTRIPNNPFDENLAFSLENIPAFQIVFQNTADLDVERFTFGIDDELDHAVDFVRLAFQD